MSLVESYEALCASNGYELDDQQIHIVHELEKFSAGSEITSDRCLYLWGKVGRGKTMLMDLFFEQSKHLSKRRVHFHSLIREIRDLLALETGANPMTRVAAKVAPPNTLICIDELHVSDVDTALVLEIFLKELVQNRLVVVTTSNFSPSDLLADETGVSHASVESSTEPVPMYVESRNQILSTIRSNFEVLQIGGDSDYRASKQLGLGQFSYSAELPQKFAVLVRSGKLGEEAKDSSTQVFGRQVKLKRKFKSAISADYSELCEGLHSYRDYLELLKGTDLVMLENVHITSLDGAKRFGWLVEVIYDSQITLLIQSTVPRSKLFDQCHIPDHLKLEFERIMSRVIELTS